MVDVWVADKDGFQFCQIITKKMSRVRAAVTGIKEIHVVVGCEKRRSMPAPRHWLRTRATPENREFHENTPLFLFFIPAVGCLAIPNVF